MHQTNENINKDLCTATAADTIILKYWNTLNICTKTPELDE